MRYCLAFFFCCWLATSTSAEILVSDRATNQVLVYDEDGTFVRTLVGDDPTQNGGLFGPSAMAVGPTGDLLVASQMTGQVLRYDLQTGSFLGEFASQLYGPSGLYYDNARDRIYVSTFGNFDSELVMEYQRTVALDGTVTGELLGTIGTGTGASGRTSLTIGPDDNLYVAAFGTDQFFSGAVLGFSGTPWQPSGTLAATAGLAGANDFLFHAGQSEGTYVLDVVGLLSFNVARFQINTDAQGKLTSDSGQLLITENLDFPSAILDLGDGTMLVTNLGNDNPSTGDLRLGSVARFDIASGEFMETFIPGEAGRLAQPTDILQLSLSGIPRDCSGDGKIDAQDLDCSCGNLEGLLKQLGLPTGDIDADGTVQFPDFVILANHFGKPGTYTQGDLDCDGTVDFSDFVILANHFGELGTATAAAVPEPASGLLFFWSAAILCGGGCRGRRVTHSIRGGCGA